MKTLKRKGSPLRRMNFDGNMLSYLWHIREIEYARGVEAIQSLLKYMFEKFFITILERTMPKNQASKEKSMIDHENITYDGPTLTDFQKSREIVIKKLDLERTIIWEEKALKLTREFEELCATEETEAGEEKEDIENKIIVYDAFSLTNLLNSRENEFEQQKLILKTAFEDKMHIFLSELKEMCFMETNFTPEEANFDEKNDTKNENINQSSLFLAPLWKIGETAFKKQELTKTAILEEKTERFLNDMKEMCAVKYTEANFAEHDHIDMESTTKENGSKKLISYDIATLTPIFKTRVTELIKQKLALRTACQYRAQKFYNEVKEIRAMENIEMKNITEEESTLYDHLIIFALWMTREANYTKEIQEFQIFLEEKSQLFLRQLQKICSMKNIENEDITRKENLMDKKHPYEISTFVSLWNKRENEFRKQEMRRKIILKETTEIFLKDIKRIYAMKENEENEEGKPREEIELSAKTSANAKKKVVSARISRNYSKKGEVEKITIKKEEREENDANKWNLKQEPDILENEDYANSENNIEKAATSEESLQRKFTGRIPSFYRFFGKRIRKRTKETTKTPKVVSEVEIHIEREEHSLNEPTITLMKSCNENIDIDETKTSIAEAQVSTGFNISTRNCLAELLTYRENEMKQEKLERNRALQQRAEKYRTFIETYAEGTMENIAKEEENEKNHGTMRNLDQEQDVRLESKDDSNSENDNETATTSERSHEKKFPRWIPSFCGTLGKSIRKKTKETKKAPKLPTNYSLSYASQAKISEKIEEKNTDQEKFPKCQPETSYYMIKRKMTMKLQQLPTDHMKRSLQDGFPLFVELLGRESERGQKRQKRHQSCHLIAASVVHLRHKFQRRWTKILRRCKRRLKSSKERQKETMKIRRVLHTAVLEHPVLIGIFKFFVIKLFSFQ
ncbi:IgA FC receptor-like isoform X2 [Antechinus flavipes]|uniref:IgA FC receptor-like isoform X2 n=1 Tax=Antechinus flavipes TaxID=38775 RepID=UPI0022357FEE|nr:IgA FC receptor-like isoform X2 [Antechinus flavipes]